jgi:hypothetical protein
MYVFIYFIALYFVYLFIYSFSYLGNDLSRTLGWGPGYEDEPLVPLLKSLYTAQPSQLDR